jgi:hypothetical protein
MGDAHAEHVPEGLVDPAVAWGTLGAHVVNAKGAHSALEWGGHFQRTTRADLQHESSLKSVASRI